MSISAEKSTNSPGKSDPIVKDEPNLTSDVAAVSAPAPLPASDVPPASLEATLQSRIKALKDLHAKLHSLRAFPGQLIKFTPALAGLEQYHAQAGAQARRAFREIDELKKLLNGTDIQEALKTAKESEVNDATGMPMHGRRESRKRKRAALVESPSPFPSFHSKSTSIFPPPPEDHKTPITADKINAYIREHNQSSKDTIKAHLWVPSRRSPKALSKPIVVRVTIRDVMTAFVKLTANDAKLHPLTVESAVAFAPREKKGPYSHSDFAVYQKLSQQISRLVQCEPHVSLPQLMDLLSSYIGLFVTRCSKCERVLSLEGHVPPVGRYWVEPKNPGEMGHWDSRHISCLHG